ncbi:hypothetical protein METBIDRAFT_13450 [Metschnikowia bicuspidata var. bicuspidata NRRL YB-4993]|uniref:Protein kinase domain-containing protein n=1 Tax=Metschnikowia bicuspidata var. bicuspidata NRRL YB-4993 TaxID=869754 RepID=A0A1A0H522_9ASCO|nr:hypothetical protein METBIDRAFT_13450 [Metschnikowia bicuspidata var. bicuspidata NRRL YB-4993]OBA19136.1 hypothetical protein METBIDRAFT_13450 [Metschnikowia bicuspidata var. bicuspidata NRRL YB-4993]
MTDFQAYKGTNFYVPSRYKIQEVLGRGSYGVVCVAIDTKSQDPVKLAVKKICKILQREILLKRAIRELKLMRFFRGHRNIVSLVDVYFITLSPYEGLYCFQEHMDYDLARVLYSTVQFLEFHIRNFLYQVVCGIKYIHLANVVHRDLKPGNILVSSRGVLKICDFGLARAISGSPSNRSEEPITNYVATRWYRAPELILRSTHYGKEVDMWAVGCILGELYGRQPLMPGKSSVHQLHEIIKYLGSPPPHISIRRDWDLPGGERKAVNWSTVYPFASADSLDLLGQLLKWEPTARLDVEQTIAHSFFKKIRDITCEPQSRSVFNFGKEENEDDLNKLHGLLKEEVAAFQTERNKRLV